LSTDLVYDNGTNIGGNSGFDGMLRTSTTNNNRVMDINPEDIESMSVLKGPAASALYGSRAAAGVVIITTKKGKVGSVQVNVSSKYTYSWVNRLPEQQSGYTRGVYNQAGAVLTDQVMSSWGAPVSDETMYNNIKDFFRHSKVWDNSVSISGGNERGSFYLSGSRFEQDGIIPKTGYDKTTFRFNGDQKYGRLTVGANVAYSVSHTRKTLTSSGLFNSGGTGAMTAVYGFPRSENMKHYLNEDGSKYRMFPAEDLSADYENPYWIINKDKMYDKNNRFTGSINASYKVFDWWDVTYRLGYDTYTTRDHNFIYPGSAIRETFQNGKLSESDLTHEYLSSNLMMNFHKTFGDFDLNLLVGQSVEDTKGNTERRNGWSFVTPGVYSFENIAIANKELQSLHSRKRLMGLYGEFRAAYKNIAYLTVTGRNDWSSTLPKDNRSYFYPSVSGSFVFTEVMPKYDWLSFGKIRASWAEVGKDTDPYVTNTYLWSPLQDLAGLSTGNSWTRGNPYLKPERTRSWEAGLEMRFFNGRLGFDYTYYRNKSIDQIIIPRLSNASGYILLSVNCGSITNKGMELSVTGTPIQSKNFTWDVTLNMSGNRGTVDDLLEGQTVLYVTDVQVGNAKAASYGLGGHFMGIAGDRWDRSSDGNVVVDKFGFPISSTSGTLQVGNREPKFQGGLNNNFQYKNWSLSFLLDFRVGGDIYNGTEYMMTNSGMSKRSGNRKSVSFTGEQITGHDASGNAIYSSPITTTYEAGKSYAIDGQTYSGEYLIQQYYSSYMNGETAQYITKTNWLRLRSISLSYDFKDLIKGVKFIKGATATLSGNNLFLWTNYKGMDPETSAAGSGVTGSSSVGIDYCGVPATAGMSFGVNLTF
jgi:ferric enterobactin receptor